MAFPLKHLIIKVCPKFMMKPALAAVRNYRLARSRVSTAVSREKALYYCPCCRSKVISFIPADFLDPEHYDPARYDHTRQDVLCPACRALPRHRILASWCEGHKALLRSSKILYFAPEFSMTKWMNNNGVKYTTADLYSDAADLKLDIQATGLPDGSYDMVICNHVLEHVDDFRKALSEIYRILRPGGSLICSFPMDANIEFVDEDPSVQTAEERRKRFGQYDHLRVFGMKADQFLTEAGFKVTKIRGEDCPDKILPVVGPADYDIDLLFYCMK